MPLALSDAVRCADTDRGVILLDSRSRRYYELNDTAATMLHELLAGEDVTTLARRMSEAAQLPFERVHDDLTALIKQLRELRLVEG